LSPCRTSIILNTTLYANPGTLGGFPGGGSVARLLDESVVDTPQTVMICDLTDTCDNSRPNVNFTDMQRSSFISNNVNGPGSGNLRVYPFVIRTAADVIPEVQSIRTGASSGQSLSGGFILAFRNFQTPIISFDVSSVGLKAMIENSLNTYSPNAGLVNVDRLTGGAPGVGAVDVSRSRADAQGGHEWRITFNTAIGNLPQMTATSLLQGLGANISTATLQQGNEIGGSFVIRFNNQQTTISSTESANSMLSKLLLIPAVSSAFVERTDPTGLCDDGLCPNGPFLSRGYMWTIYVTSDEEYGNTTPYSPTSPVAMTNSTAASITVDYSHLTGTNAYATVSLGLSTSLDDMKSLLALTIPFSLAFGGGGGSYGGSGGKGYSENPTGPSYGDEKLVDLFGGSGGCMRSRYPFEPNAYAAIVSGQGGAGGGALELIAINDIIIGSFGQILMVGGYGQQTSVGGGGGGSGGAVLLSAGGAVVNEGVLDVSGGAGGYGGAHIIPSEATPTSVSMAGGGGGGGRIAVFAESVVNRAWLVASGGPCGVLRTPINESVLVVTMMLTLSSVLPLDSSRLIYVGETYLSSRLPHVHHIENSSALTSYLNETYYNTVLYEDVYFTLNANIADVAGAVSNMSSSNLADVLVVGATIISSRFSYVISIENTTTYCDNPGYNGTVYTQARMAAAVSVERTDGGEGTKSALLIESSEDISGVPLITFNASQPGRFTYYTRLNSLPIFDKHGGFGAQVALISSCATCGNGSSIIGIFTGESIMHGANFDYHVDDGYVNKTMMIIDKYMELDKWYKMDIHIDWMLHTYNILVDDVLQTKDQTFLGDYVDGIKFSTYYTTSVWFDEIYVGFDNTMQFICPQSISTGVQVDASVSSGWNANEVNEPGTNGLSQFKPMSRHYSFYQVKNAIPLDGQGAVTFSQDYKFNYPVGNGLNNQPDLYSGSLLFLSGTPRSTQVPGSISATTASDKGLWWKTNDPKGIASSGDGRQFFYSEYDHKSDITSALNGGVCACSSQDLVSWRFEGIVMHYTNLTDMVFGTSGAFHMKKPKVLLNNNTKTYVMWAIMDNINKSLGMSVVLTSLNEDGPFFYRRSLYPDGNVTRDQVTSIQGGQGILSRTYYQTVEYVLPEAMMQPVWESVKLRNGATNFRNNYHRTNYDVDYDNYHDIFLQRWRKEDKPWEVLCVDRITGVERSVSKDLYDATGVTCNSPEEYKVVVGQGNPLVKSNYVDPNDPENSWWHQSSVPAVSAQPWNRSVEDGLCGLNQDNYDIDILDPNLVNYVPLNRSTCSNIADNPIHAAVQDKLIGVLKVTSRRRAKFISISKLTSDYLDTSGELNSYEGELESGDLISLLNVADFGFTPGTGQIQSTFHGPVLSEFSTASDYKTRFRQFIRQYNDRAYYSLACIIDGTCPVNYRDEITVGNT
jgi:hypothetical protein